MSIGEIKKLEMQEIIDFYYFIEDYGHIFHLDDKLLDEPFQRIIDAMNLVRGYVDESWDM